MTLDQLETFVTIALEGGLRAASKVLHKTQPTLSTGIRNLEQELGVELLDRDSYRVKLSPAGETLYAHAIEVLEGVKKMRARASELTLGREPKLHLVIDHLCPMHFLLNILNRFSKTYPSTRLEMDFDILSGPELKLLAGESDIAVTPFLSKHGKFEFEEICEITVLPVASKDLIRAAKNSASFFSDYPQIVVKNPARNDEAVELAPSKEKNRWIVSDHMIKRELIINGFGWGHLEKASISKELADKSVAELKGVGLNSKKLPLYLVRALDRPFGPVAQDLWDYLKGEFETGVLA